MVRDWYVKFSPLLNSLSIYLLRYIRIYSHHVGVWPSPMQLRLVIKQFWWVGTVLLTSIPNILQDWFSLFWQWFVLASKTFGIAKPYITLAMVNLPLVITALCVKSHYYLQEEYKDLLHNAIPPRLATRLKSGYSCSHSMNKIIDISC